MSSPLHTSLDTSSSIMRQLSTSPRSSSMRHTCGTAPSSDTSSALRDLFEDPAHEDASPPDARSSFEDTLARISSQHETYKEDSPENDVAFQALLQPVETSLQLKDFVKPSSAQEFITLHKSLNAMPDRPKTSPSKLALSVVLKPNAEQEHGQRLHDARARLKLLAPLEEELATAQGIDDEEDSPRTLGFNLQEKDEEPELELLHPASRSTHASDTQGGELLTDNIPAAMMEREALSQLKPVEHATPDKLSFSAPLQVPTPKLEHSSPQAPTPRADALSSSLTQGATTLLKDAVTQSHKVRQVALSMEQSPQGQKIELDITDSFGRPLTLKISFEHQRARAACYGSHFHDPAQLDYVLDAVRTALAASGYELGDFITHHQRSRQQPPHDEPSRDGAHAQGDEAEPAQKKKEILHVVGIINRIA